MIAVFGADGLLGSWICYRFKKDTFGFSHAELDVTDSDYVHGVLKHLQPDAVINCAGITNKRNVNPEQRMDVNGKAPHNIAKVCDLLGIRLVHVSTDCVFSGDRGNYTEADVPDADDNYGWTKLQGEVEYSPHITVRASFIGWPDPKGRGLLAWLNQQKDTVQGYTKTMWNGLTAPALADYLTDLAYERETGLMHIYGETVSKYDILKAFKEIYNLGIEIEPVEVPVHNRTLSSIRTRPREHKVSLYDQLDMMRVHRNSYKKWLTDQEY